MPLQYTAQVSNHARSAGHPYGLGIGWTEAPPDRELQFAGQKDGRFLFRDRGRPTLGFAAVTTHESDACGVFSRPLGTVGDALTLKIDYPNKQWHVERRFPDGRTLVVDPSEFIGSERSEVAFMVGAMIGPDALAAGPSRAAEVTARWQDGRYHYALVPSACDPYPSGFDKKPVK